MRSQNEKYAEINRTYEDWINDSETITKLSFKEVEAGCDALYQIASTNEEGAAAFCKFNARFQHLNRLPKEVRKIVLSPGLDGLGQNEIESRVQVLEKHRGKLNSFSDEYNEIITNHRDTLKAQRE
eukprot:NODE_621_length_5918_cov_0.239216.p3 type:complete len:126 gc:universal NODE_621_length_5918_cov_0.239216:1552-1929(+)